MTAAIRDSVIMGTAALGVPLSGLPGADETASSQPGIRVVETFTAVFTAEVKLDLRSEAIPGRLRQELGHAWRSEPKE